MQLERIDAPDLPAPGGHYCHAVKYDGLIYLSGQLPLGAPLADDDEAFIYQTRQCLANLLSVLDAAGGAPETLVKVTAYIVGVHRWPLFNDIYAQVLKTNKPARTVVPVGEIHYGYLVELDAIGCCRDGKGAFKAIG